MRGRAFKVVLALDGMPRYALAKSTEEAKLLASAQFRIAPSLDYIEEAHTDMLVGPTFGKARDLGLMPFDDVTRVGAAGKHVLSINIGNAPYHLRQGSWSTQRDIFAKRAIATLGEWMPDLPI